VTVEVRLPSSVTHVKGGKKVRTRLYSFKRAELPAGENHTFKIYARVKRNTRSKTVKVRATVSADRDVDERDNGAADSDSVSRRRQSRASSLAQATSLMPSVAAPLAEGGADTSLYRDSFGGLCRIY